MTKILIVDDSTSVHVFTKACLKKIGFNDFTDVFNGQEATQIFSSDIDLILLDWEMPVMNGPETVKWFRSNGIKVPIIIMTTRNSLKDITYMLELGADDYMMKPFTSDIIEEKIKPFIKGLKHDVA